MLEVLHVSGHAFVAIGRASFERGLRVNEREALVTAMMGPDADPDKRRFVERQLPRKALPPEQVEVPAFLLGREPLPFARATTMATSTLQDLGWPEALGDDNDWQSFLTRLPDGLRRPTEDE